mgnify:FL=1
MKKVLLSTLALLAFGFTNAQEEKAEGGQTSKGKWLIEANTGNALLGNTSFYYTSTDVYSGYNLGLDGGYFIMDDLALKGGFGYGRTKFDGADAISTISYRLGAKYYIKSMIPVTLDVTGASVKDALENPLWLGIGAGYAWFLGDNVSVEPGVRYNHSLNEDYTDKGAFQFNIGFALHF